MFRPRFPRSMSVPVFHLLKGLLLLAALALVLGGAPFFPQRKSEAIQAPKMSLDMVTSGNTYDSATNSMSVGGIDNCLTSQVGNNAQHNHTAHLVIQNVEDLVGWQARMNYDGGRMRPSGVNFSPFADTGTGQNISFVNLPLDGTVHRDLTTASNIPAQAAGPQTALIGATYNGTQTFPVSPDTPAKSPPDDTSYSAPSGGVLAAVNLQVLAGQVGVPSLYIDLADGNPNAPGSNVVVFTSSGSTTLNLAQSDLGDGFHGEGVPCLSLGPVPPLPTTPPPPAGDSKSATSSQNGNVTVFGPQQVNVSNLPQASGASNSGGTVEENSPLSPGPSQPGPVDPRANAVDNFSSPPGISAARFEGMDNNDNSAVIGFRPHPPDPQLAVGPNHVEEMVNEVGRIYTRTGGTVRTFSLQAFFAVPGNGDPNDPTNFRASDPKILYDARSRRWFASYVSKRVLSVGEGRLHLAVSGSDDPTGTWSVYYVSFLHQVPDYAGLGLTNDKVTVSANLFDIDGQTTSCPFTFCYEQTIVFDKANLLTAVGLPVRTDRFSVRPVHSLSSVNDQYLVTRADTPTTNFCNPALASTLTLIRITGTPGAGNVTEASAAPLPILPQTQPSKFLEQPGTSNSDLTIDCRILEAVWLNGPTGPSLWASATTGCFHDPAVDIQLRSCAHLIQVDTGTNTVSQDIVFGYPFADYVFPAIRMDMSGDLFVSFSRFTGNDFPGGLFYPEARIAGRRASDPLNAMDGSTGARSGDTTYCVHCNRWGDYMGAALDPNFPECVWVVGEYSKNIATSQYDANWGTYIAPTSYGGGGACLDSDTDGWSDAAEAIVGCCKPGRLQQRHVFRY